MASRELLLLRHGKADRETAVVDYERPLTRRGRNDTSAVGAWLKARNQCPDLVLSSPARRAADSAARVVDAMQGSPPQLDDALYNATPSTLLEVLARHAASSPARVLLVGHNPGLEGLLLRLCQKVPHPPDGNRLPTATLAQLHMPEDWLELAPGCAQLLALTRPGELR